MTQIKKCFANLGTQLREKFKDRTQATIDNVLFVLECESEILKGRETRYVLAYDGNLGIQPTMKDSIRKPVVFPYNGN
ncbi:MAG: hypothetical protein KKB39_01820 [Nanoarchaeota archaeon]|nr:hypothetical protein [Nanoarchaeota archaeon]